MLTIRVSTKKMLSKFMFRANISEGEHGMVASGTIRRLLARQAKGRRAQRSTCPLCGRELLDAEIDHKQPLSRDGTEFVENLWVVCKRCNRAKGIMTLYEYLQKRGE